MRIYDQLSRLLGFAILLSVVTTSAHAQVALEKEDYDYAFRLYNSGLYDIAASQFLHFAEAHPESPKAAECVFMAGRAFLQANQLARARRAFTRVVVEFPESGYVDRSLFGLARVYARKQQPCAAAASLERVAILTPKAPGVGDALFRAARWYVACGRVDHAARLLQRVLQDYRRSSLADLAKLELAKLRLKTGKPDLAEALLDQLKPGQTSDSLAAEAALVAGRLYETLLRFDKARDLFAQVAASAPTIQQKALGQLRTAELELLQGNPAQVSERLANLPRDGLPDSLIWRARLLEVASAVCQGLRPKSSALFTGQPRALPPTVRREILLARTLLARQMGNDSLLARSAAALWQTVKTDSLPTWPVAALKLWLASGAENAVRTTIAYAHSHPSVDSLYGLSISAAQTFLKIPHLQSRARGLLSSFLVRFPAAPDADLAALLLFQPENTSQVRADLEHWFRRFPESELQPSARSLADSMDLYVPILEPDQLGALLALAAGSTGGTLNASDYLEAANLALFALKDYSLASKLARQAVAAGLGGTKLAEALDIMGTSFLKRSRLALRAGHVEVARQLADSARLVLDLALRRTVNSDCHLRSTLAEAILSSSADVMTKLNQLRTLATDTATACPDVPLMLSRALWDLSGHGEHDSTALEALRWAEQASQGKGEVAEEAAFLRVRIALSLRDSTLADEASSVYLQRFGPGDAHWGRVTLLRARLMLSRGQAEEAAELARRVVSERSYADLADSARVIWARAERERGRPTVALRILGGVRDPHVALSYAASRLPIWTVCFERQRLQRSAELKLEIARIELAAGNPAKALSVVHQLRPVLASLPAAEQVSALMLQAEAAKKLGRKREWLYTLRSLWNNEKLPASDRRKAGFALLQGLLEEQAYEQTAGLAARLKQDAPQPEERVKAAEAEVVCAYRLGHPNQARTLAKAFEKEFKGVVDTEAAQAHFAYEEGEYYYRQKVFDRAEKAFRRAAKYEGTKWARLAEFAIAKTFLTLNKTDKALNQLTDLPQKYPGTEVADLALLNLGVFYHQNKQLANAIFTLSKVVADSQRLDPPTLRSAERELIRCYDEAGMWDRAISLTRDYLRRFPDADDAFSRKIQLAVLLIKLNEYDRAIDYLRRLKLEADPESQAEVQYWIGKAFLSKGHLETAIAELLRVRYACPPTKLPWDITAMFEAATAYVRLEQYDRAEKLFEEIVRLRGSNSNFGRSALQKIKEIQDLRAARTGISSVK